MVRRDPGLGLSGVEQTNFRIQQQRQQRQLTGGPNGRRDPDPPAAAEAPANNSTSKTSSSTKIEILDGSNIKQALGKLSLTNLYQVNIGGFSEKLRGYLGSYYNVNRVDDFGLLCADATLPTSSFATAEVKDNFMGITQEFAHTRLYTDLDFTFYVDSDYSVLRFFEGWMDFVSGGNQKSEPEAAKDIRTNVYRRFNYPKDYKVNHLYVNKFERTLGSKLVKATDSFNYSLQYQFINAFPKGLTAMPVSYGPADILKVTVTFNFDRYIVQRKENIFPQLPQNQTSNKSATPVNNPPPNIRVQEQRTSSSFNPTETRQGVRRDSNGRLIR